MVKHLRFYSIYRPVLVCDASRDEFLMLNVLPAEAMCFYEREGRDKT